MALEFSLIHRCNVFQPSRSVYISTICFITITEFHWVHYVQCLGIIPLPFVLKIVVTIPGTTMPMLIHPKTQWFNRLLSWKSFKNVNLIVWKLRNDKNYQFNYFFNLKKAQNMDTIFCNLEKLKKHESYFLKATKSKHYEFDFFFQIKKLEKAWI